MDVDMDITVEQIFRNERHDPNRISSVTPAGHPGNPSSEPISRTILEEIRNSPDQRGQEVVWFRRDIVLVSLTHKNGRRSQAIVEAYADGVPRGDGWRYLDYETKKWAIEENRLLVEIGKVYPEMERVYLRYAPSL